MDYTKMMVLLDTTIFTPNQWVVEDNKEESHNKEYSAGRFSINSVNIRVRVAKVTPTKIGQFVVFWEKDSQHKNQAYAYDEAPPITMVIVFSPQGEMGAFLFPKEVFLQKGILKTQSQKGKMAMRVYPPWDEPTSKQAIATQKWQLLYYAEQSQLAYQLKAYMNK